MAEQILIKFGVGFHKIAKQYLTLRSYCVHLECKSLNIFRKENMFGTGAREKTKKHTHTFCLMQVSRPDDGVSTASTILHGPSS